jgi:hypothetical protein
MANYPCSRGTKAFSCESESKYPGSFPVGYLRWLREQGWWGDKRIHLCAGGVKDDEADRVDIQEECTPNRARLLHDGKSYGSITIPTNANIIADGRDTGLESESYDCVIIDPPYSKDLAHDLYDTSEHYSGIKAFMVEGYRLLKPGGLMVTLTYAIPPRIEDLDLVAMWGIYQIPPVRWMTAHVVWRKPGEREAQGLERWMT